MAGVNNDNGTVIIEKKRSISPESHEEVRVLGIAEYEQAAQCLAEAFAIDDVARYFIDTDDMAAYSEDYKWNLHCDILRYMTSACILKGIVTSIGPNYEAVALWLPPGKNIDDLWTTFRSGLWRLWYKLSSEGRKRWNDEFMPLLHDTFHNVLGEREDKCYYLVYLGSKRSARGKGYARKLIQHMTAKADAENCPTYLESSALGNLPYYEKYGFQHRVDIQLERGPKLIKLHIMVREPQTPVDVLKGKKLETVQIRSLALA